MNLSRRVVIIILCALFLAAVAARVSTIDPKDTPYYKGASAMSYRHTLAVADGQSLSAHDDKAGHPQGYVPARYRAAGVETLTGLAFRAFRFVSDIDGRPFTRRLTMFIACLCVFTGYGVASRLWNSRGAGVLAAFLVAFLPVLVGATNGRVLSHTIFATLVLSLHAWFALRALASASRVGSVISALVALLLLWIWEPAAYVIVVWLIPVALRRSLARPYFVASHAAAIVIAGALMPHLIATRALGAWTTAVALSATVVAILPESRRAGWRGAAWLVLGTAAITLVATPVRSGAGEQFPGLAYVLTRLRYVFGRPEGSLLSDWMRHLWSTDHAPLTPQQMIQLFVPLALCAVAWFADPGSRTRRALLVAAVLLIASVLTTLDRSALPLAAVAMIVLVSGAARDFDWRRWKQSAWVIGGCYAALSGVVLARSAVDPTYQIAKAADVVARDPAGFVWVSFENTDRELVRFISTRTSVSESILAPEDMSALLLAFSGRTAVQLPGTTSRAPSLKHVDLTRAFFRDEAAMYEICHRDQIDYVVYSIDILLDDGPYSPRSMAGVRMMDPLSLAVRMHFEPESLEHFTLLYENDHYRLFKVTASIEPVFLTDHPLFYQPDLFVRDGRNLDYFRDNVVWLMLAYADALSMRARGDAEQAKRMLEQCLRQAPRFTKARLALADALMDLGRYDAARDQIATVIEYAPDNPTALYAAAFVRLQLGQTDEAKTFLALLAQTGDSSMQEKGRALQYYIDHNLPLKPGAPP